MKPFIYIKHNLPNNFKSKVLIFAILIPAIVLIISALLFTAVFAIASIPFLGIGLYCINKIRKGLQNSSSKHINSEKIIDVKEWKVIR